MNVVGKTYVPKDDMGYSVWENMGHRDDLLEHPRHRLFCSALVLHAYTVPRRTMTVCAGRTKVKILAEGSTYWTWLEELAEACTAL